MTTTELIAQAEAAQPAGDDLVRRLSVRGQQEGEMPNHYVRRMEIERIEAKDRIEQLTAERDALVHDLERLKESETHELNRAERAEADLAETEGLLAAALEAIEYLLTDVEDDLASAQIARATLARIKSQSDEKEKRTCATMI